MVEDLAGAPMRIPIPAFRREPAFGRCDPPGGPPAPAPATGAYRPSLASLIPAEWVGLTEEAEKTPPDPPSRPMGGGPPPGSHESPSPLKALSVIASVDPAVLEHVTPVTPYLDRGMCVVEPGKPCRSSGRCRQRGY